MEFTLETIISVINEEIREWRKKGSVRKLVILQAELDMFIFQIKQFNYDKVEFAKFEIPKHWEPIFIKINEEYKEYLRLKEKYENL